jgi:hypothetical protein
MYSFGSLKIANLNHWTDPVSETFSSFRNTGQWTKSINRIILERGCCKPTVGNESIKLVMIMSGAKFAPITREFGWVVVGTVTSLKSIACSQLPH